ncbi:MAG TPA: GNAT family N-acetyltransferase [Euzebyales bacterium]|nr:GNAT family N-acetyltransferase [Euzebyales bacterium]
MESGTRVYPSVDAVEQAWSRLADETRAAPFLWPGWCRAWLHAFGEGDLTIHTVWRDGRLVALLPLLVDGRHVRSPTNDQTPLFGPLAIDADAAERLVAAVAATGPSRLDLGYLDPRITPTAHAVAALRRRGHRPLRQQTLRAPFTDVTGEWAAFTTRLGKKRRAELRRSERRLREQGDLRVEVFDGGADLDRLLAEGFRVEASGWKGAAGTAIQSTPTMRAFYTAVGHWASKQGWLRLVFLRLDERAIAFEFILEHDDRLYDLKGGYDERYRTWGPGIWLMHHILREAFADDTRCIEWLGTDDPYKLEWSDGTREHVTTTWFAPTVRGIAEHTCRSLWRTSRDRGRQLLRERLPAPVIERMKAVAARAGGRRPGR